MISKVKELTFCEHNFDNWIKSSTILIRQGQVPSRSPNLLSSQNFSRLPFLAGEKEENAFAIQTWPDFGKCFEILASILKIAGKSMGWGSTCRYEVRPFLPPLTGVIEPRTKIVLDLVKSSKLCSILNAQRIQACAMRFCKIVSWKTMMYA